MAKIFYSSSTNSDSANKMKELILSKKDYILDIDDYSKPYILDKILNTINDSNIFICDISPNKLDEHSPNVMIELGYAINKLGLSNILIIFHKTELFKKHNISMLDGIEYTTYDDFNDCDVDMIIGKIEELENKYKDNIYKYTKLNFTLSERSYNILTTILDVKIKQLYFVYDKNDNKFLCIIDVKYNGEPRIIDITTKNLKMKKKIVCLSNFKELYDELCHLELLVKLLKLDNNIN
jgi:predicted transcriptional regulator